MGVRAQLLMAPRCVDQVADLAFQFTDGVHVLVCLTSLAFCRVVLSVARATSVSNTVLACLLR
jgi:hypothetical protein